MMKQIVEKLGKSNVPILVIIVGESGVGKTTFVNKMKDHSHWFESSRAMVEELENNNQEISHETIHKLATEKYRKNPYWQISDILERLHKKKYLFLDGPRRLKEVEALLKENIRTLVVKIKIAENEKRADRLRKRDRIKCDEFERILEHESKETELDKIMSLADVEVVNDNGIEKIEDVALIFEKIIISCLI